LQLVLAEFDAQGMSGYHPAQTKPWAPTPS
jgi:hypothetical protein